MLKNNTKLSIDNDKPRAWLVLFTFGPIHKPPAWQMLFTFASIEVPRLSPAYLWYVVLICLARFP